jgi:hypothetical protein
MTGIKEQRDIFSLIGRTLKRRVECYVIGGSAMLFYRLAKTATKDIDIVALSEEDALEIRKALERIGFRAFVEPGRQGEPMRLSFGDHIIDVFSEYIMKIKVSESMLSRVREKAEFGNFVALVAAPEDIMFSKCMTEREGDRKDAADIIARANIDWDAVLAESEFQMESNPQKAFGVFLFDFLDDLAHNFGVDVPRPVVKKLMAIAKEQLDIAARRGNVAGGD